MKRKNDSIKMPSSKVAPAPGDAAAPNPKKLSKLWQTLEPLMTEALSACVLEEPDDPLGFVIERLSAAHQRDHSVAPVPMCNCLGPHDQSRVAVD